MSQLGSYYSLESTEVAVQDLEPSKYEPAEDAEEMAQLMSAAKFEPITVSPESDE